MPKKYLTLFKPSLFILSMTCLIGGCASSNQPVGYIVCPGGTTNCQTVVAGEGGQVQTGVKKRESEKFRINSDYLYRGEDPEVLTEAASRGDAIAAYKIGQLYRDGVAGEDQNVSAALAAFQQAADADLIPAQYDLAELALQVGDTVEMKRLALRYLNLAVDNEYPPAYRALGELYYTGGDGIVRVDTRLAADLFERADSEGVSGVSNRLAEIYFKGNGRRQNPDKAIRYTRAAAESGDVDAQRTLGLLYMEGYGSLGRDFVEANRRLNDAARNGDEEAAELLKELEQKREIVVLPGFQANGQCVLGSTRAQATLISQAESISAAGGNIYNIPPVQHSCGNAVFSRTGGGAGDRCPQITHLNIDGNFTGKGTKSACGLQIEA